MENQRRYLPFKLIVLVLFFSSLLQAERGSANIVQLNQSPAGIQLENVPVVAKDRRIKINGRLLYRYGNLKTIVLTPENNAYEFPILEEQKNFEKTIILPKTPGKYLIQIIGENEFGPVTLALFPVYYGMTPSHIVEQPDREVLKRDYTQFVAEKLLFNEMNKVRSAHKLPPLEYNIEVQKVAVEHSIDMAVNSYFSQGSVLVQETAGVRLKKAGIKYAKFSENIAFGTNFLNIQNNILSTPGTLRNILDKDYNRVGIGITKIREFENNAYFYITMDFIKAEQE